MKKLAALLGALLVSLPAVGALSEGDIAPAFRAQAALDGAEFTFSLREALARGPVVVYFYPSAYTGGCNLQAHTFAVNHDEFTAAGASIIGVSLDSIERLKAYSADPDYCAGRFAVAADASGDIARTFDLHIRDAVAGRKDTRGDEIGHGFAERTTFVITPDGRIAAAIGGLAPADNVARSLEIVRHIAAQRRAAAP